MILATYVSWFLITNHAPDDLYEIQIKHCTNKLIGWFGKNFLIYFLNYALVEIKITGTSLQCECSSFTYFGFDMERKLIHNIISGSQAKQKKEKKSK